MASRLKTLVIENFRSLRGKIVVPLDAQVVLIHGTNGMGKTSVLSALELGLTGRIGHLATDDDDYQAYITALDTESGSIQLTTTNPYKAGARTGGLLDFSENQFHPSPLLDLSDAKFFAERCYLPQATLSRLLEIYDDLKTNTTSPLTQFVKELLGLDPLDALIDGLHPAYNVTRIRNLAPEYRHLEALHTSLREEIKRKDQLITNITRSSTDRFGALNAVLGQLPSDAPLVINNAMKLDAKRIELKTARDEERVLIDLSRTRSELKALSERWRSLPVEDSSHDRASKKQREQAAAEMLAVWRAGSGNELDEIITMLRTRFLDLPLIDDGPEESRAIAERRADAEATRCATLVNNSTAAAERANSINVIIQRATTRIDELNIALAAGAKDTRSLASALAGVAPHVSGETCPVCNRDFSELGFGSLSTHIAEKIASLTSEAGRLQSLANERAEESKRLSVAKRDLLSAGSDQLSAADLAELTVRAEQMASATQRLNTLAAAAKNGTTLMAEAAITRGAVSSARRRDELVSSIFPEIENIVVSLTNRQASTFDSIEDALTKAEDALRIQIQGAESLMSLRIRALSELDLYAKDLDQTASLKNEKNLLIARLAVVESAISEVDECRNRAKKVADTAFKVRSSIVTTVFNTSLNKVWRDLFVRLAPYEQFVPTFKLPQGNGEKVEAVLETLHRSGKSSGSPGAMLSQGNLNTAALTLFLALHLSVPSRMPWLVLDDPVQSMDDVHIAQFAALLRTLSKGMERQLIVAVHERALFEYLTLELSPAFPGDSLISVEITQNFEGYTVATPRAFGFEKDRAIA